jgi:hypothetical protein
MAQKKYKIMLQYSKKVFARIGSPRARTLSEMPEYIRYNCMGEGVEYLNVTVMTFTCVVQCVEHACVRRPVGCTKCWLQK